VLELTQRFKTLQNENARLNQEQIRKENELNQLLQTIEKKREEQEKAKI